MHSVLQALQDGRLIELPDTDKERCLRYLATLIEAIPGFRQGFDFVEAVFARERAANTAIGRGWACPHGRVPFEGDLYSAVGWSPQGLDWGGAPDGKPVHVVVMHYIPASEKNTYLKELSTLAHAIMRDERMSQFEKDPDLAGVRNRLLDLLSATSGPGTASDAKARMIQLEAKQATIAPTPAPEMTSSLLTAADLQALSVVVVPGARPVVLAQDAALAAQVESSAHLAAALAAKAPFDAAGCRLVIRSVTPYPPDRFVYDCLAVRLPRK
jgi:mannitol/fructose-specific phosphotransferase system IIA component (Ntr-type)